MGRIIDTDDAMAIPTNIAWGPPTPSSALPRPLATTPSTGTNNDVAAECEMKLENPKQMTPARIITIMDEKFSKGTDFTMRLLNEASPP